MAAPFMQRVSIAVAHTRSTEELSISKKLRIVSRMFTRPVFAQLASSGNWETTLAFLEQYNLLRACRGQQLSDLFETAWGILRRHYRTEYVYKAEIANRIVFGRHSPRTTSLQVEFPVSNSIADVAVFNGTSTAYEVKTEYDSQRRLQTQTRDYLTVFDRVFVVTHPGVAHAYSELVDRRVGVLALAKDGRLAQIKEAQSNAAQTVPKSIFRCLRRAEYVGILENGMGLPENLPNGLIARECEKRFCSLTAEKAHAEFVCAMRKRQTDVRSVEFLSSLPKSLRALGYATPLSLRQRNNAISVLQQRVDIAISL